MTEHTISFDISFKKESFNKKFRVKIPASDENEAFDKAMSFIENNISFEIISINDTEFVIPIEEEKESPFQGMIEMGDIGKAMESLDPFFDKLQMNPEIALDDLDKIEEAGNLFIQLAKFLKKQK